MTTLGSEPKVVVMCGGRISEGGEEGCWLQIDIYIYRA